MTERINGKTHPNRSRREEELTKHIAKALPDDYPFQPRDSRGWEITAIWGEWTATNRLILKVSIHTSYKVKSYPEPAQGFDIDLSVTRILEALQLRREVEAKETEEERKIEASKEIVKRIWAGQILTPEYGIRIEPTREEGKVRIRFLLDRLVTEGEAYNILEELYRSDNVVFTRVARYPLSEELDRELDRDIKQYKSNSKSR